MKKTALRLTAISVLIVTALGVSQFGSSLGNFFPEIPPINTVYIRADGSIEPSTALIAIENNVYTLTGDLTNTTIKIERDGIILDGAGYAIIGNDIQFHAGVDISNRTGITVKNVVINQFGTGILMENASKNTLKENKITSTYIAFNMDNADSNIIVSNTAVTLDYGIFGTGSYNQITDNNFSCESNDGCAHMGISLRSSNNNTLSLNNISHGIGINFADSHYNTISNNTLVGGNTELDSTGILLTRSANNQIFGNVIKEKTSVSSSGLHLSSESANNFIFENLFERNTNAVALCYYSVAEARSENVYNNTFYRNSFVNNANNVRIAKGTPVNHWDNGQQGNFWSDYEGVDSNHDGKGDTPYIIDENNQDNYPLMIPYSVESDAIVLPQAEPFLIIIATIFIAVAVGAGLLFYLKKRGRGRNT
ncbi:MAG: right-handed parallel beta-helix repeat-containing protein [Candidatus Bathyarchaeota archaeon]|nr:right-handed parallel beta-helix repeat-containing protein [Candidatus Bathyarchaeota archaeon]